MTFVKFIVIDGQVGIHQCLALLHPVVLDQSGQVHEILPPSRRPVLGLVTPLPSNDKVFEQLCLWGRRDRR